MQPSHNGGVQKYAFALQDSRGQRKYFGVIQFVSFQIRCCLLLIPLMYVLGW
jgi:hypothetical protein